MNNPQDIKLYLALIALLLVALVMLEVVRHMGDIKSYELDSEPIRIHIESKDLK